MPHVLMIYSGIPYNNFNSLYDTLARFKAATDSVKALYPTIDCKVELIPELKNINVKIGSDQPSVLEQALGDYVDTAGTPFFVHAAHHYDLMERILQPLGLTLKRKFIYWATGKWVVPLPANKNF